MTRKSLRRNRPEIGLVQWFAIGDHAGVERVASFVEEARIRHLRLGISWADMYTPEGAAWVDALMKRFSPIVELLPCVSFTPPSIGIAPTTASPPRDPKAYADFLDVFVTQYGDRFEWVELWNEPNNLNDWDWRLDPEWEVFSTMVGGAAYWMKERGKKTVLGGTCPTDGPLLEFLRQRGVLQFIDAISVHGFPGTWTPHWEGWAKEMEPVRAVIEQCPNRPELWITEAGYSTWRHDEARQVAAFVEAAQAPAERMYWYSALDLDPSLASQEGFHFDERHYHCGILGPRREPKLLARLLLERGVEGTIATSTKLSGPRLRSVERPILITGGAGFVGANIADRLASAGRQVMVFDSLSRRGVETNLEWLLERHPTKIVPAIADVRDPHAVREAVRDAEAVLHLAAQVAVTTSLEDPLADLEINTRGTLNVLEAARASSEPPPLLFASTNKVYGKLDKATFDRLDDRYEPSDEEWRHGCSEAAPLDLYSPYGCSKGAADQYVRDYARVFGLRTLVFRMSCLYGPRQFGTEDQGWLAHFVLSALKGNPITIYGDGRQVRDALFVSDAADAWLRGLQNIDRLSGSVFNLGGGPRNSLSLRELLRRIEALTGIRPKVEFGPWRPGDQLWYVSDTRAFEAATGWQAEVSVDQGLRRLLDWLRLHLGRTIDDPSHNEPQEVRA